MYEPNSEIPQRLVLDGVPRIHFFEGGPRCPEDITLPSVMRALAEYLGEDDFGCRSCGRLKAGGLIDCSYAFFLGVTGGASFLSWKKGWHGDNGAIFYMSADPSAPERWALRALGYKYEWIERVGGEGSQLESDRDSFRMQIIQSIQRGKPVIAYGVIGPPEPAIISGYDESGEVLIGWSFFQNMPEFNQQVEFEADGQFRKRGWFADTHSLLILGEKQERPAWSEIYKEALEWAVKVTRTPAVRPEADAPEWYRERANGLAAYDAWAEQLLQDEDFVSGDETRLHQLHEAHDMTVGTLAEARWYGSLFFIQASNPDILHFSKAEDLMHAAACYAAEHDLMWKIWDLAGGIGNPDAYVKFADPDIRRQMVHLIYQAREKDRQAIEHIERVLAESV